MLNTEKFIHVDKCQQLLIHLPCKLAALAIQAVYKYLMSKNVCILSAGGGGVHKYLGLCNHVFPVMSFWNVVLSNIA
jgi:hypothetical protein